MATNPAEASGGTTPPAAAAVVKPGNSWVPVAFVVLLFVVLIVVLVLVAGKSNTCAGDQYGPDCAACPDCGEHGSCNNGSSGNGKCACIVGWKGDKCDTRMTQEEEDAAAAAAAAAAYPLDVETVTGPVGGGNDSRNTEVSCADGEKPNTVMVGCTSLGKDPTRGATIENVTADSFSNAECVAAAYGRGSTPTAQCVASAPFTDLRLVQTADKQGQTVRADCSTLGSDYRLVSCMAKAVSGVPLGAIPVDGTQVCEAHSNAVTTSRAIAWCAASNDYNINSRVYRVDAASGNAEFECPAGTTLTSCSGYDESQGVQGAQFAKNKCTVTRRGDSIATMQLYAICTNLTAKP